jgi:hypothetical protein
MLATDDGVRTNVAPVHELQIVYDGAERRLFDIARDRFAARGGNAGGSALPGGCGGLRTGGNDPYGVPYGCGRADIRLAQDSDGEVYLLSKSDGMIRKLVGLAAPPLLQVPEVTNSIVTLRWSAISNRQYRVQFRGSLAVTGWTDLAGDVTASNSVAVKTNALGTGERLLAPPGRRRTM